LESIDKALDAVMEVQRRNAERRLTRTAEYLSVAMTDMDEAFQKRLDPQNVPPFYFARDVRSLLDVFPVYTNCSQTPEVKYALTAGKYRKFCGARASALLCAAAQQRNSAAAQSSADARAPQLSS
jgi:hypothetical protein